ncbi:MAG: hypothetical protein WA732_09430, partial [Pseudolabrys sp.]
VKTSRRVLRSAWTVVGRLSGSLRFPDKFLSEESPWEVASSKAQGPTFLLRLYAHRSNWVRNIDVQTNGIF